MEKILTCVDLGAGLGGLSEAFWRSHRWIVDRVDNDPELASVPGMVTWDYTQPWSEKPATLDDRYDLVLAGPECREFSLGFNAPSAVASRAGVQFSPDMTQIKSVQRFIDHAAPTWWLVENVMGSIKHLQHRLGTPQIIGSRVLYGTVPQILVDPLTVAGLAKKTTMTGYHARSLVPLPISTAIMEAVEEQRMLSEWVVDGDSGR